VEDLPMGYPRFTGLIGAHIAFSLSRRFPSLRARLLLLKQDRVVLLESRLEEIDRNEERPIFLASMRRDHNPERKAVLEELDTALCDYDRFLERNVRILQLPAASQRNKRSLRNWVTATGSICAQEASFLYERDLCTAEKTGDGGLASVENFVEDLFAKVRSLFCKSPISVVSREKNIFIFTGPATKVVTRLLITWLIVALLLVPVILMHALDSVIIQIICIMIASGIFILVLSSVLNAKASDIFIAGPT
ncbi:hypothetical protein P154DRAFT_440363, partial [Amniculicola lignicola CBS 123094]